MLLFLDGFDHYTAMPGVWTSSTSTSISSGKLVAALSNTGHYLRKGLSGNHATLIINFRAKFNTKINTDEVLLSFFDGISDQCKVTLNNSGQFGFFRGAGIATAIGSRSASEITFDDATYYDIEVKITFADAGSGEIKVNGSTVLTVSGDFQATANAYVTSFGFGRDFGSGGVTTSSTTIEHVVVMDATGTEMNNFLGPIELQRLVPTADGALIDLTANTGTRWDAVDDNTAPDDATTYIESATVAHRYSAIVSDLPAGVTTVHAVAVWLRAARESAATRGIKGLARISATNYLSTDEIFPSTGTYGFGLVHWALNPATVAAWTPADVNGVELGVEVTT